MRAEPRRPRFAGAGRVAVQTRDEPPHLPAAQESCRSSCRVPPVNACSRPEADQPEAQHDFSVAAGPIHFTDAACFRARTRASQRLSGAQRQHHRAVHAGGLDRHPGADVRTGAGSKARQDGRGREPAGRRPADRRRRGRQGRARRPHAADGDELGDGRQSDALQEDRLRSGEGFRADRDGGASAVHPAGQSGAAGQQRRRADRLRQGQPGQAQLRLGRHRRIASSLRRAVQQPHRHRR